MLFFFLGGHVDGNHSPDDLRLSTKPRAQSTSASIYSPFTAAARNCMRLQVLELDHVSEINQEVAAEVCREGLKGLEMFVLTSTPVTPKALLHFNSEYRLLIILTHEHEETVSFLFWLWLYVCMNWYWDLPPTRVGVCRNLKSIVVQIGIEDYFEDPSSPEARKLFDEMVNKLQVSAKPKHQQAPTVTQQCNTHTKKDFYMLSVATVLWRPC